MREKYTEECKTIQQNCTYTAEDHHQIASWNRTLAYCFQIIPAVIAAGTSTYTAIGNAPDWIPIFTTITAVISAVSTVLNPNKNYQDHLNAAKNFTTLKHDARFLCEAEISNLGDEVFYLKVKSLHEKYNDLVKTVPPTDGKFFEKARKIVQGGYHEPDKTKGGNIK